MFCVLVQQCEYGNAVSGHGFGGCWRCSGSGHCSRWEPGFPQHTHRREKGDGRPQWPPGCIHREGKTILRHASPFAFQLWRPACECECACSRCALWSRATSCWRQKLMASRATMWSRLVCDCSMRTSWGSWEGLLTRWKSSGWGITTGPLWLTRLHI